MQITFLMPCYCWEPSGGFRVIYGFSNQLAARGHDVAVIHPQRLAFPPPEKPMATSLKSRFLAALGMTTQRVFRKLE